MTTYYRVGVIVNTQGLDGRVRVKSMTDFAKERFAKGSVLALFDQTDTFVRNVTISQGKLVKNLWQLKFDGLDDINLVEKFRDFTLKVAEENLTDLTEDEFYYHEIIGCEVFENDHKLGVISEILQPGANDVWVVKREHQKDLLLPYIDSVILNINVVEKRVEVDVPLGLDA